MFMRYCVRSMNAIMTIFVFVDFVVIHLMFLFMHFSSKLVLIPILISILFFSLLACTSFGCHNSLNCIMFVVTFQLMNGFVSVSSTWQSLRENIWLCVPNALFRCQRHFRVIDLICVFILLVPLHFTFTMLLPHKCMNSLSFNCPISYREIAWLWFSNARLIMGVLEPIFFRSLVFAYFDFWFRMFVFTWSHFSD